MIGMMLFSFGSMMLKVKARQLLENENIYVSELGGQTGLM
jgi:hypothetical protein